jgi:hypothetical protein
MRLQTLRRIAQPTIILIILAFWAQALAQNWQTFVTYPWQFSWTPVLLAFAVRLVQMPLAATIWWRALTLAGTRIPFQVGMSLYLQSQIGRYLPGGIWDVVGRFVLGERAGVSKRAMAASIGLEMSLQVLSGAIYLLTALALRSNLDTRLYAIAGTVVALGALIFLSPPVFTFVVNRGLQILKRPPLAMRLTYRDILALFVARLVTHGMLGLGFYLFALALTPIPLAKAPLLISAYVGAWLVGYLALLAPMGIGVREGAFVLLAKGDLLFAVATAATVGYRIMVTLRDLLAAGLGVLLKQDGAQPSEAIGVRKENIL